MSDSQRAQAAIQVDEYHTYEVMLGNTSTITWKEGKATVRINIPYEKQRTYGDETFATLSPAPAHLELGTVEVTMPNGGGPAQVIPVQMPAGKELASYIKTCQQMLLPHEFPLPQPKDTLIDVGGAIFDGIDKSGRLVPEVIFDDIDAFTHNLRLRLNLWAPDLLAKAPKAPGQELTDLLGKRENDQQIFLPSIDGEDGIAELAQSLVALANNGTEGRILLGVEKDGKITGIPGNSEAERQSRVQQALLQATLRCKPHVLFAAPKYHSKDDKYVAIIEIKLPKKTPATNQSASGGLNHSVQQFWQTAQKQVLRKPVGTYQFNGFTYHRKGNVTIQKQLPFRLPKLPEYHPITYLELDDVLTRGDCDDVLVLDASNGIGTLPIGAAVCGLVNAGQRNGMIVVRNLPSFWNAATRMEALLWQVEQQLFNRLRTELAACLPRLKPLPFTVRQINDERVAIITLVDIKAPVMFYGENAYDWAKRNLTILGIEEVFIRYLKRNNQGDGKKQDKVHMAYGELEWPIQPPRSAQIDVAQPVRRYDVQRQAVIWEQQPFTPQKETAGLRCTLTVPINQALMTIGADGKATQATHPVLKGRLFIRFDDVLASNLEVKPKASPHTSTWFHEVPVRKRTHLRLEFSIQAQELFERRRHAALLRFRLPDVTLDADRMTDLRQIFTDLEFFVQKDQAHGVTDTAPTNGTAQRSVRHILQGVRTKGFADITFTAGILCEPSNLIRELHYEDRTDSKGLQTARTEIRVLLECWGASGPAASDVLAQLHLELYELISQRFQYLRTE